MENIRYEVWLQNQDKFVTQWTIIDSIFFRIRTIVHCVANNIMQVRGIRHAFMMR